MSLIKKIDVPRHMAARRAQRHLATRLAIQPQAAAIVEVTPPDASAAEFREDFSAEHSSSKRIGPAKD